MTSYKNTTQDGFAIVEAVLIVIIIGLISGISYWLVTQRNNATKASIMSPAVVAPQTQQLNSSQVGTTTGIDSLLQSDSKDEATIDSSASNNQSSAALSTTASAANIGGSYDESTL